MIAAQTYYCFSSFPAVVVAGSEYFAGVKAKYCCSVYRNYKIKVN